MTKVNISSKLDSFRKRFGRFYVGKGEVDIEYGSDDVLASDDVETFIRQMAEELLEASRLKSRELAQEKILDNTDTEYRKEGFNQAVREQSQLINDLKE